MIETIRVSQKAKDQLLTLKRRTGITQWNVLCRWALLRSLAEPHVPTRQDLKLDSNLEMSWRTFAGEQSEIISALLRLRVHQDGLSTEEAVVEEQFRLHLHRGVGYLVGDEMVKSIEGLVSLADGRAAA